MLSGHHFDTEINARNGSARLQIHIMLGISLAAGNLKMVSDGRISQLPKSSDRVGICAAKSGGRDQDEGRIFGKIKFHGNTKIEKPDSGAEYPDFWKVGGLAGRFIRASWIWIKKPIPVVSRI